MAEAIKSTMEPTIAYIAQGRLFLKAPGRGEREIQSTFARQFEERQAKSLAIDGWKGRSGVWGGMGVQPPEWSQWAEAGEEQVSRVRFLSVSRGPDPDSIYYMMALDDVVGLFRYDLSEDREHRLMHRHSFPAETLAVGGDAEKPVFAIALARENGTTGLSFSHNEGRFWSDVTGGDSVDQAPAWNPSRPTRAVFQSAGVGRNQHGVRVGLAPYAVEAVDIGGDGEVRRLWEDPDHDFLLPREDQDGWLYAIRRPYRPPNTGREVSPWQVLQDIVYFPYRLARALFYFLNFLSLMFSGKPLATTHAPTPEQRPDQRLMLWGHMIDTKSRQAQRGETAQGWAPKDWELVRRNEDATETLASGVLAFDVWGAWVACSDGRAIRVGKIGQPLAVAVENDLIESVAILA